MHFTIQFFILMGLFNLNVYADRHHYVDYLSKNTAFSHYTPTTNKAGSAIEGSNAENRAIQGLALSITYTPSLKIPFAQLSKDGSRGIHLMSVYGGKVLDPLEDGIDLVQVSESSKHEMKSNEGAQFKEMSAHKPKNTREEQIPIKQSEHQACIENQKVIFYNTMKDVEMGAKLKKNKKIWKNKWLTLEQQKGAFLFYQYSRAVKLAERMMLAIEEKIDEIKYLTPKEQRLVVKLVQFHKELKELAQAAKFNENETDGIEKINATEVDDGLFWFEEELTPQMLHIILRLYTLDKAMKSSKWMTRLIEKENPKVLVQTEPEKLQSIFIMKQFREKLKALAKSAKQIDNKKAMG